jgi:hypothetical protein
MTIDDSKWSDLKFWPLNHQRETTNRWYGSNCVLAQLLKKYHPDLNGARAIAAEIRLEVDGLAPAMAALCRRTCRFCPEPCCINHTVWFDFRDLLRQHLLGLPIPDRQAATPCGEACPFLGHHGCRLPWAIRPWMCIKYICPAQRRVIKKTGRPDGLALDTAIDAIDNQRLRLETEVIRRIRPRIRTSPSSFSACSG